MMTELTLKEFKNVFEYLLNNNKDLIDNNQTPIAIGIEGPAGLGKTSIIEQIAEERGMTLCKLNLSQLEEVGELTGFPMKEYEVAWIEGGQIKAKRWYTEVQTNNMDSRLKLTGKTRMSYAPPAWLPDYENPNGTILLIDDYTRANNLFMQAIMELINRGEYISWKLPKYTNIVCSSNPDNGEYNVSSLDEAQKSRMINFNVKLDMLNWAEWAENNNIDGRAINFALMYKDEIFVKKNDVQIVNPRSYTTFCKAINCIKDWDKPVNLSLILQISKGCFLNDPNNIVGNLFTTFINNKLDKLIQPKEMIKLTWDELSAKMEETVYVDGKYRTDIANILTTRFVNYVLHLLATKGGIKENDLFSRILEIIENPKVLFTEDLIFYLIKTLVSKYPGRTSSLLRNEKIRNKIIM